MTKPTTRETTHAVPPLGWDDDWKDAEADRPPLTPAQADELRAWLPQLSPWAVVGAQTLAGVLCVALAALLGPGRVAWSAFWGASAVVLPGAVMAWGLTRRSSRIAAMQVHSLFLWEGIKISMSIAMLVAVVIRVHDLHWPAMLAGLVLCLKAHWLALLRRGRVKNQH
ncbi:MAG: ATP synthase subunit I [Pelomonas sp.]|nr:ATP synthase subunit I [Roseateles sp.]